jgi:hypothetical protein
MNSQDQDAVSRAKADIVDFDRKINMVRTEQARLEAQFRQLETERNRIQAFVEMYERYTGRTVNTSQPGAAPEIRKNIRVIRVPRAAPKMERKPDGIPAMPEMIKAAIKDAVVHGRKGLEPKEMTAFIRQKWWPHVKGESVSPIAWRMVQQGQLKKDGALYKLA